MNDVERGRELSRLMKMQGALKKAHPSVRKRVEQRIDGLLEQTASRFIEVFGQAHPIVKALERASPDQRDPGIL